MAAKMDVVDVIYNRYSTDLQRDESNVNQERRCRELLDQKKIPHNDFEVIADEAISGTREDRPGLIRIKELMNAGRLGILIVSEQSRLTRNENAKALIKDIVFHGGRFLSVSENVDSEVKGWQTIVGINEINNTHTLILHSDRVRAGQEGRVLDGNGSAGDFPFGYRSIFIDPAAALACRRRGPKPKKEVVIDDVQSSVVRQIFERFIGGESIGSIVRWLNQTPTVPRVGKALWHHEHVRRILLNEKYIGIWKYGKTTTIQASSGKKKQISARDDQRVTTALRPHLRIIDEVTWNAAQAQLAKLTKIYGMKEGDAKRGPAEHYQQLYAKRLLNGKIRCPECGRYLIDSGSTKAIRRLGCPNHRAGACSMATRVPLVAAEQAVTKVMQEALTHYPEWLQLMASHLRKYLQDRQHSIPTERDLLDRQLREKTSAVDNLLDLVADGTKSQSLQSRIESLDSEIGVLKGQLKALQKIRAGDLVIPDDAWISEQLRNLNDLLISDGAGKIGALRDMIGDVDAEEIKAPGKQRGFMRLRFRLHGWKILKNVLNMGLPSLVTSLPSAFENGDSEQFVVDLGKPTPMDHWAPQIVTWRKENVSWTEIAQRTGLKIANAWLAHKRFIEAGGAAA